LGIFRRDPHPERLPPGQWLTGDWPVLHHGEVPRGEAATWKLRLWGEVTTPAEWTLPELQGLGARTIRADMHCVTTWSKYDNDWTGLPTRRLADLGGPTEQAAFVIVHAVGGYTTNLAIQDFLHEHALLAWAHAPEPLTAEHGGPLRLVVPHLYAWKSAKWVTGIELLPRDRRGFWEERGYHNHADPWREERYAYQEE
jgi:DMSO/TMAO reductase YedYZ molybdopterin-dependent catalytic subunit